MTLSSGTVREKKRLRRLDALDKQLLDSLCTRYFKLWGEKHPHKSCDFPNIRHKFESLAKKGPEFFSLRAAMQLQFDL